MFEIDSLDFEDARYEKKFPVFDFDIQDVKSIIKLHPAMFSEIFYKRKINNIYFDSINFKNYHEHLSGISKRLKIRVRWYGKTFGIVKDPVLEIKIKNNELGKKSRFALKSFRLDKSFSLNAFYKIIFLNSNLPEFVKELLNKYGETDKKILVVSHGAFLKILIGDLLGMEIKNSIFNLKINHCSPIRVNFSNMVFENKNHKNVPSVSL